jgi:hypothetical protein
VLPEDETNALKLLQSELRVINIGLRKFAHDLEACNVACIQVDWTPPAVSNAKIASLLGKLGG